MARTKKASRKEISRIVDESIRYGGSHIILPDDPSKMTARQASEALAAKADEEEQIVSCHETIEGNPFDALVALQATIKEMYGWSTVSGQKIQSFFGPMDVPAHMLDVRTGPNPDDVIQVPVGDISAPGLDFAFNANPCSEGLALSAELRKYQAEMVKKIASATRAYLRNNSIYKNKAFEMPNNNMEQPKFLSFDSVVEEELILSESVGDSVEVNVFTPIRHTDALKRDKIPVKRTIVLAGKYGTGKSMTLATSSKIALDNGWTVIYLKDTANLVAALEQAKRQQPCLVVAEDIDQVADRRDKAANDIFNTLSGVLSTGVDIQVLLTTNHADRIDRAMVRPGRIDALIEVTPPDAEAVERLVHLYGRGILADDIDLTQVGEMLDGQIPATIREVVERSKLARIATGDESVTAEALVKAIHSMGPQIELLNSVKEVEVPTLDQALAKVVRDVAYDASREWMIQAQQVVGNEHRADVFKDETTAKRTDIN